jgi:hypothetical protein
MGERGGSKSKLKFLKVLKRERARKTKGEYRHKTKSTPSLSSSLAPQHEVFQVPSNKTLIESKVHEHLDAIKSYLACGTAISRDALAQLFSTNTQ